MNVTAHQEKEENEETKKGIDWCTTTLRRLLIGAGGEVLANDIVKKVNVFDGRVRFGAAVWALPFGRQLTVEMCLTVTFE